MDSQLLRIIITAIILLLVLITIGFSAFSHSKPTCKRFLGNSYLYLLASILFLFLIVEILYKFHDKIKGNAVLWIGIIGSIAMAIIYSIFGRNPKRQFLNHFLLFTFIVFLALLLYPVYKELNQRKDNLLRNSLIITGITFVILSLIAFLRPQWFNPKYMWILVLALLIMIIVQLIVFFLIQNKTKTSRVIISGIILVIFFGFVLFDTRVLLDQSKSCTIPNYPYVIGELLLDFLNIFVNIANIGS